MSLLNGKKQYFQTEFRNIDRIQLVLSKCAPEGVDDYLAKTAARISHRLMVQRDVLAHFIEGLRDSIAPVDDDGLYYYQSNGAYRMTRDTQKELSKKIKEERDKKFKIEVEYITPEKCPRLAKFSYSDLIFSEGILFETVPDFDKMKEKLEA